MAAVTFQDNYVIMTSLVTSHRWIFITRRANLIVSVTDEIALLNFYELINGGFFCHTTISGATTNTGTSTIYVFLTFSGNLQDDTSYSATGIEYTKEDDR